MPRISSTPSHIWAIALTCHRPRRALTARRIPSAARNNRVRDLRSRPGNSVASIARLLGVTRSTIYLEGFYLSQQALRRLDPAGSLSVVGQRQHQAELVGP
jgi:hypothetical protein